MLLRQIFDADLAQYSYLVACQQTSEALIVDPHRDVDQYLAIAAEEGVAIVAVAETHIHADFLSGAKEMVERCGARAYLSAEGTAEWQYGWAAEAPEGKVVLLSDGESFAVGRVELRALATPGHTPEHLCFLVTDRGGGATTPMGLLSGDFLLVGDLGRPDLLELAGNSQQSREDSARDLYASAGLLARLPEHLQIWPAHGAGSSCAKAIGAVPVSTLGYERRYNRSLLSAEEGEAAFVEAILRDQPTPPSYFGRMKRSNRDGPPLLRRLPRPRRLAPGELEGIARHGETIVIDARASQERFMEAHLPGSLHAPVGRSFSTAVGSTLTEETRQIVLVVEANELNRAVRDLVRMGYDRVVGYIPAADLEAYFASGGEAESIPSIDFADVEDHTAAGGIVIDVRDHFEYASGHIPGAVNAPYKRLPEYLESRIPSGRPLIVHCESGLRSAVAASWLAAQGREVLYVGDDWSEWEERDR